MLALAHRLPSPQGNHQGEIIAAELTCCSLTAPVAARGPRPGLSPMPGWMPEAPVAAARVRRGARDEYAGGRHAFMVGAS